MSCVEAGQVFRFVSRDLDLTLVVLSVDQVYDPDRSLTTVLLLDVARTVFDFRADVGETTDWLFARTEGEWPNLLRLW